AVRFVYPMISLEGRAWWILRTAPVALRRLWWSKFWIAFVPLLGFAEVLVAVTSHLLGTPAPITAVFLVTLVPLVGAVVSLGLAFGAAYPRLDTQNAAQIATGFGAIVYMVTSLLLIAAVVGLEAWPVVRLFEHATHGLSLDAGERARVVLWIAAALTVAAAAFVAARRL